MPKPKKIEFECKVITPMFLAGADQNKPELRVSSLRGQLRWWLRALLGATSSTQSSTELFNKESEVFGSVDKVSEIMIKINVIKEASNSADNLFQQVQRDRSGMRYLWYSTKLGSNNRPYFEPEKTQFKVSFISKNDEALKKAVCAFWALSICGGLGTRSRRGAGSFSAKIIPSDVELNTLPEFNFELTPENFSKQFQKVAQIFGEFSSSGVAKDWASFSKVKIFLAGINEKTWEDAVNNIGNALQHFRVRRDSDYQNVEKFIQSGTVPKNVERAAFGLPLMFRYRSLPQNGNNAIVYLDTDDSDRRASPLWISIVKPSNGQYDAVLTYFESKFLPDGKKMCIKRGRDKEEVKQIPNKSIIESFVEEKLPNKKILLQR